MDNKAQTTDENLRKNLGNVIIQWIRMINQKKPEKYNSPDVSDKYKLLTGPNFTNLISVTGKNNNTQGIRNNKYYTE